jgi:hypothetical protein
MVEAGAKMEKAWSYELQALSFRRLLPGMAGLLDCTLVENA